MKKIALSLILGLSLYASTIHQATVQETLNSGGYTYMKVKDGNNIYWIAMTQRNAKVGDTIKYDEQGWMKNFHSKTLNRTFDNILFAGEVTTKTQAQKLQAIKPNIMGSKYQTKGTITIAELFKNRDTYVGKTVTVRAKVTKVSKQIMKLNWIHLEDGSRFSNMDDLVFTSSNAAPKVGDIVYAKGTVVKDKDFGYGYFYPLIIQEASFSK
ncbi:OB-fold nucleic acid binding domain-containing protein [Sulfurimonas sp.]